MYYFNCTSIKLQETILDLMKRINFKWQNLIECPECNKSDFIFEKNYFHCNECKKTLNINKNKTYIFEKVYEPKDKSINPYIFSNKKSKKLKNWRELNYLEIEKWIKESKNSELILDLGCGPLTNVNLLKKYKTLYVDGAEFESIDLVCNFEKRIAFKSCSFDKILLSNVLEHIYNPLNIFREVKRLLKPNGECLILVPFLIKLHQEPYDFNRYTKHFLRRICENNGLEILKIENIGSPLNILENISKIHLSKTSKKDLKDLFLYQLRIFKLLLNRIDGFISRDEKALESIPQGYMLLLKKNN